MRARILLPLLVLLCFGWSTATLAQEAPTTGFRGALLKQTDRELEKFSSLAEAIPADLYDWRPADGVRSIGEVVAHVAGANYFFPTFVGVSIPEGIDARSFEKERAAKDQAVETLKTSINHMHTAISNVNDTDLEKTVDMFGNQTTYQGALLLASGHISEHLGQLIAYARMNGVTPPWSE